MYRIKIKKKQQKFVDRLPFKTRRIIEEHILILRSYPHSDEGAGDKERLELPHNFIHRMHVSRSYTIFYKIHEEEKLSIS